VPTNFVLNRSSLMFVAIEPGNSATAILGLTSDSMAKSASSMAVGLSSLAGMLGVGGKGKSA
jgi:hypothetical protein